MISCLQETHSSPEIAENCNKELKNQEIISCQGKRIASKIDKMLDYKVINKYEGKAGRVKYNRHYLYISKYLQAHQN